MIPPIKKRGILITTTAGTVLADKITIAPAGRIEYNQCSNGVVGWINASDVKKIELQ